MNSILMIKHNNLEPKGNVKVISEENDIINFRKEAEQKKEEVDH